MWEVKTGEVFRFFRSPFSPPALMMLLWEQGGEKGEKGEKETKEFTTTWLSEINQGEASLISPEMKSS